MAKRLEVPNNASGYAASDLALFDTLMPTAGQPEPRQAIATGPRSAAPRPLGAAQPERGRAIGLAGSRTYSDVDHAKFLELQASFTDIHSGVRPAESYQPSAAAQGATRGYSQQDIEAFERLARFGPAW